MLLNKNRIIFLALLDAAMRYREMYFREEIEDFSVHLNESLRQTKITDRGAARRAEKKKGNMVINFKNKQEEFNRIAYKKVEEIVERMNEKFKLDFDNYATGFAMLMEEFLKAKNTTHLLTVCKLYNNGNMDETFNQIKKQRENEKANITTDSSDIAIESNDSIMQEEQQSTSDDAKQPTADNREQHRHI